ncbi:hypothetical protein [Echinicola vietnamensis]|uniref:Uncharacterized protein n=1 Tax=Echinicola vietnamensis (strain DSM 17526 / LMG 23754 / KMM 6221) TaxID=926556 RepID=L0FVM7_ECHVK|nr:hypothetical protein [Echinicola vietnamensis]AGA76720.1 hypothetical protein Echvi_0434 [Echinicola vietnamensis DSM 17526]
MNIAFTTILIFLLLAPGFLARIAFFSSKVSIRDRNKNLINELTWSIIPSLTIHIIAITLIEFFTNYEIDFNQLGHLILGVTDKNAINKNFGQLKQYLYPIFFYNLSVFSSSILMGYSLQKVIRKYGFDRRLRYLRFSNKWHYIFTGECLDFPDVPDDYEEITDKIINVLCKVNEKTILYTGEYFNYYIDNHGDLEAVHLKYPIRRYLENDANDKNKYYSIESRYLVIPSSEIININFRYFNKTELSESDLTEEEKENLITVDNSN